MPNRIIIRGLVIVALLVVTAPLCVAVARICFDPEVPFLFPQGQAHWIEIKRAWNLGIWQTNERISYRTLLKIEKPPPYAILMVRALRSAQVYLDGILVMPFADIADWKYSRSVDLKEFLSPGLHELRVDVFNRNGPALLLAYSKAIGVSTGAEWEASIDGASWRPASVVAERMPSALSQSFPSGFSAFRTLIPLYLPLFLIPFFSMLYGRHAVKKYPGLGKVFLSPSSVRWLLLGAWVVLAANNMYKLTLAIGFDVVYHREYISYIIEKGAIPLATDGWQMFQAPLYYLATAPLCIFLSSVFSGDTAERLLRLIPLTCGALQVEMAFRAVRYVFPKRNDLQALGTLIGGLLPMNLYISQVIGNEPMAGLLSSGAIVMVLRLMSSEDDHLPKKRMALLGLLLGLALLTKFTAVLLIISAVLALIYVMLEKKSTVKFIGITCLYVLGVVVIVSGWYYLRNWIDLGTPYVSGWDPSRKIIWWQDPGFRTLHDFLAVGQSLSHPIYSGLNGFWDSIYSTFWLDGFLSGIISYDIRPPWNYDFILSSALLSTLPTAGILLGFMRIVFRPKAARPCQLFSAYCIALFISVLLYLYVTLPIYSTAKATYTIGLIPCYAILCVTGLDRLTGNRYIGAAVKALVICWAVTAYFSYFVI